jgi:hypothetical protein
MTGNINAYPVKQRVFCCFSFLGRYTRIHHCLAAADACLAGNQSRFHEWEPEMVSSLFRTIFAIAVSSLLVLAIPLEGRGDKKTEPPPKLKPTKPKPAKAKPVTKPAPKPAQIPVHPVTMPASSRTASTVHTAHYHSAARYVGHVAHSRTWWRIHNRRHGVYVVKYRARHWGHREFAVHHAARTFYHYLGYRHYQRRMHNVGGMWVVSFRSPYAHRYGIYTSHGTARRVEMALRSRGLNAWIHWHHI